MITPKIALSGIGDEANEEIYQQALSARKVVTHGVRFKSDCHAPSKSFVLKAPRCYIRPSVFRESR